MRRVAVTMVLGILGAMSLPVAAWAQQYPPSAPPSTTPSVQWAAQAAGAAGRAGGGGALAFTGSDNSWLIGLAILLLLIGLVLATAFMRRRKATLSA